MFIAETDEIFDLVVRDGIEIEIIFLAVCQYDNGSGFYLFGCDKDFNDHTDFYYDTLEDALEDAKRMYGLENIYWKELSKTMD